LEQLPHPDNRVTLSDQKDALGLPKPQFHYAFDDYVERGMAASRDAYARIAELMGAPICATRRQGSVATTSI
jgi:hypothetical protein